MSAINDIPEIPKVDKRTPYQDFKKAFMALRETVLRGWLTDGQGTTVTDSAGGSGRQVDIQPAPDWLQVAAALLPPLTLIAANDGDAKVSWIYGTVAGMDLTPDIIGVSDGDYIFAILTVSYDDTTGVWSASGVVSSSDSSVPAPDATHAYLSLGYASVSGSVATAHPALSGSQGWRRCGNNDGFQDNFFQGGL